MKQRLLPAALALAFVTAMPALAHNHSGNNDNNNNGNNSNGISRTESRFIQDAAAGNLHEIAAGNVAQTNSSSSGVQAFGATLVADHTAAYNALVSLTDTNGVTLPTTESRSDQRDTARLARLTGDAFDAAFLREMIADHILDIQKYEAEAVVGRNADVRAYAREQLPVLVGHLVTALQLQEDLGLRNSSNSGHH